MARDDFSRQTLDVLGKRVGVRCSNPSCKKLTTGPQVDPHHIVNIWVGAHITAASPGGSRFDPSLTPEQRQSPENGIWLCQNCAKLVDNDSVRYAVETLREWKGRAEATALAEVEGPAQPLSFDLSAELEVSYIRERTSTGQRHDYILQIKLSNRGTEPLGRYHIDVEMPALVVVSRDHYVENRSNREIAFFRITSENLGEEIYPGDTKIVMSVPYYMDDEIDRGRVFKPRVFGNLFECLVKVTLWRYGFRPFSVERPFEEFQCF